MDDLKTNQLHDIARQKLVERMLELLDGEFNFLEVIKEPRAYQVQILRDTIRHMKDGHTRGRWDVAVGGGKTFMALSLARHVANHGGRVLFLTPGNIELDNAVSAHEKYNIGDDNYLIFRRDTDITDIGARDKPALPEQVKYFYSTVQLMTYADRHKTLPADYFDLIIFDESQGYLGAVSSSVQQHLLGAQLHMSATPYNMRKHVGDTVPHVYGKITSQELIERYEFPKWRVRNYRVDDSMPTGGEVVDTLDGDLDFSKSDTHDSLNIAQRFSIIEMITEEILADPSRRGIVYMPSVRDAHLFKEYIADRNTNLVGLTDYVAGVRSKRENDQVLDALRERKIVVVYSKDLLNQSLDIPSVTDIILADPTRSLRKVLQRIGRGVRPAPGKEYLYIHDLVSSIYNSSAYGEPAVRATDLIAGVRHNSVYNNSGSSDTISVADIDPLFIDALEKRRGHFTNINIAETARYDVLAQASFMADTQIAKEALKNIAAQCLGVSYTEMMLNIKRYIDVPIELSTQDAKFTLRDVLEAGRFYGTYDDCIEGILPVDLIEVLYMADDEGSKAIEARQQEMIDGLLSLKLEQEDVVDKTSGFEKFDVAIDYVSMLMRLPQLHKQMPGVALSVSEVTYTNIRDKFIASVQITLPDGSAYVVDGDVSDSTKAAKHKLAFNVLSQLYAKSPVFKSYLDDPSNIVKKHDIQVANIIREVISLSDINTEDTSEPQGLQNLMELNVNQGVSISLATVESNGADPYRKVYKTNIEYADNKGVKISATTDKWYSRKRYAERAAASVMLKKLENAGIVFPGDAAETKDKPKPKLIQSTDSTQEQLIDDLPVPLTSDYLLQITGKIHPMDLLNIIFTNNLLSGKWSKKVTKLEDGDGYSITLAEDKYKVAVTRIYINEDDKKEAYRAASEELLNKLLVEDDIRIFWVKSFLKGKYKQSK